MFIFFIATLICNTIIFVDILFVIFFWIIYFASVCVRVCLKFENVERQMKELVREAG